MVRWSSGQDAALSRRKQGFDSPTNCSVYYKQPNPEVLMPNYWFQNFFNRRSANMALLENWQKVAYNEKTDKQELQRFWQRYFLLEKGVYEKLLTNPDEKVEGTVKELAEKYGLSIMDMTGFLDGINESLVEPNPIDTMEEDTRVSLAFDKEKLFKNMVDAKADWLYNLPMWDDIYDADTKKKLYLEQKKSGTVIVGKKVGRNDPCPCGSGKKYKYCCGR
jgi:uncharacterized protein